MRRQEGSASAASRRPTYSSGVFLATFLLLCAGFAAIEAHGSVFPSWLVVAAWLAGISAFGAGAYEYLRSRRRPDMFPALLVLFGGIFLSYGCSEDGDGYNPMPNESGITETEEVAAVEEPEPIEEAVVEQKPVPVEQEVLMPPPPVMPKPQPQQQLPHFPWPPPKASGMEVLPTLFLNDQVSLRDVAQTIDAALATAGEHDIRFYSVPNGFAMTTRLKEIDEQGNVLADVDRGERDFLRYIRDLFWVPPGHYRMVVFVVTDQPFGTTGTPMDSAQAESLMQRGFNDLSEAYSHMPYSMHYKTTALIYEFRKEERDEVAHIVVPGELGAHYHLGKIGWYEAAQYVVQAQGAPIFFHQRTASGSGSR